ncbi:MAG: 3-methyl-2-oxobutanoate hydroxymethyltransferase [Candidatus Muiribacteriota bacterium]
MKKLKEINEKLVMLTCYDYTSARLLQEADEKIDMLLIGDSLANVIKGEDTTIQTEVDDIIYHSRAVRKGAPDIFIVADMPFMSYQISVKEAVKNAGKLIKYGKANAVKLEGGEFFEQHVKAISACGIPVMGHLGLTPQSINAFGKFGLRGKQKEEGEKILKDSQILQKAGAFSIVLECIPQVLAKKITESIIIPTIGIGAGKNCDGQVLVLQDMLGMSEQKLKFVKKYAEVGYMIKGAVSKYAKETRNGSFPYKDNILK